MTDAGIADESLRSQLRDAGGRLVARATMVQAGNDLFVRVEAAELPAGTYGAAVHESVESTPDDGLDGSRS